MIERAKEGGDIIILPKGRLHRTGAALLVQRGDRGGQALPSPAAATAGGADGGRKNWGVVFAATDRGVLDRGGIGVWGRVLPSSGGELVVFGGDDL